MRPQVERLSARAIAPDDFAEHGPYDAILELVGAGNLEDNLAPLARRGRIAVIGVGGSGPVAEMNLLALMQKHARIHGSTLRARSRRRRSPPASSSASCCRTSSTAR